jgi:hypothetical protein
MAPEGGAGDEAAQQQPAVLSPPAYAAAVGHLHSTGEADNMRRNYSAGSKALVDEKISLGQYQIKGIGRTLLPQDEKNPQILMTFLS